MFIETPDLIQALEPDGTGIHADVFERANAAYPHGVRLWDEDTGNTLEVRLCKSLNDAIYSARGAMCSQHAKRALSANGGASCKIHRTRRIFPVFAGAERPALRPARA